MREARISSSQNSHGQQPEVSIPSGSDAGVAPQCAIHSGFHSLSPFAFRLLSFVSRGWACRGDAWYYDLQVAEIYTVQTQSEIALLTESPAKTTLPVIPPCPPSRRTRIRWAQASLGTDATRRHSKMTCPVRACAPSALYLVAGVKKLGSGKHRTPPFFGCHAANRCVDQRRWAPSLARRRPEKSFLSRARALLCLSFALAHSVWWI